MKRKKLRWTWDQAALAVDQVRLEAQVDESITLEILKIGKGVFNWSLTDTRLSTESILKGVTDSLSRAQQVAELALFSPANFMFSSKEALV